MFAHADVVLHDHDARTNLVSDAVHHGSGDAYFLPGLLEEGCSTAPLEVNIWGGWISCILFVLSTINISLHKWTP